jgi:hypothetical protein
MAFFHSGHLVDSLIFRGFRRLDPTGDRLDAGLPAAAMT